MAEAFWLVLVIACLVWYSAVTFYVAFRGVFDIRGMLARLAAGAESGAESRADSESPPPSSGGTGSVRS
jgi:hypothetical protein